MENTTRVNRLTIDQCKQLMAERILPEATYTTNPELSLLESTGGRSGIYWADITRCHLTHLTDVLKNGNPKHPIMELPKGEKWKTTKGKCKKVLVHHLSWRANNKLPISNQDVSHLCGNRKCFEINHLTLESHTKNMNRVGCDGYILLVYENIIQQEVPCRHNPPCKKVRVIQLDGQIIPK